MLKVTPAEAEYWDAPGKTVAYIKMATAATHRQSSRHGREPQGSDAMSAEHAEDNRRNPPNPEPEPKGPRTPYPVDEPPDPRGPGSEPDYFPGKPAGGDLPKM